MNKKETGKQRMKEILGERSTEIVKNFESTSPDFANYIVEFCYGDIYARKGLSDTEREIALVSSLIAQGNTGFPLRAHLKALLDVGFSKEKINELIIFLATAVGFPHAVNALLTFKDILDETV